MNLNANQYPDIYKSLGIDLRELGCVMLDLEYDFPLIIPDAMTGNLYYSSDPKKFWIKGYVWQPAHVTLLYGLLEKANNYSDYIEQLLKGWDLKKVEVEDIGYFESPYPDEPYYCIVAHIKITPELLEGRSRLQFLPHIDTFPGYKAHATIAYIKKDNEIRDKCIEYYKQELIGKRLKIKTINLGDKK